ncbi:MAG TPA: DPP IV N-terminal domain-containing protein, partial [Gaiellaceae bacterium]
MRLGVLAALAVAAAFAAAPATSSPVGRAGNGMIAFTSELRSSEVYMADANGGNVRRLTDDLGQSRWPALSPDGSKIAFASKRGGWWDIYVMNIDGSGIRQLTHDPGFDGYPDWSPDGSKLAFSVFGGYTIHVFVYS